MPNLRDIRRRIRSVQNTQQITKAMKMVSAAKLRRAQENMIAARPYSGKMMEVLESLATRCDQTVHPLLHVRPGEADHGGHHDGGPRALRRVQYQYQPVRPPVERGIGWRRAPRSSSSSSAARRWTGASGGRCPTRSSGPGSSRRSATRTQRAWPSTSSTPTRKSRCDAIYLIYNQFKSVIAQEIVADRLLAHGAPGDGPPRIVGPDYLYEPSDAGALRDRCCPSHVTFQVFQALLESRGRGAWPPA